MKFSIRDSVLGVLCLGMMAVGLAVGGQFGDFEYTVTSDTTVTITKYKGGGGSVTIPDCVTTIADWAFYQCSGLTHISLPARLVSIGNSAFAHCKELRRIYFLGDAPTIGHTIFDDAPATVYYLPNTTGWTSTFGGRPAVLWNPEFTSLSVTSSNVSSIVTGSVGRAEDDY